MQWTKQELSREIQNRGRFINGKNLIGLRELGEIFADPRFPKEEEADFLKLMNYMKSAQAQTSPK